MNRKRLKKLQSELKAIVQSLDTKDVELVDELLETLSCCIVDITNKRDDTQHFSRHAGYRFSAAARHDTPGALDRAPSSDPEEELVRNPSSDQTHRTISRQSAPIVGSLPTPEGPSVNESSSQGSSQEAASPFAQDIAISLNDRHPSEVVHELHSPFTPRFSEETDLQEQADVADPEYLADSIAEPPMNSPPKTESLIANWDDVADFQHTSTRIAEITKVHEAVQDERVEETVMPLNTILRDVFLTNPDAVLLDAHDERALDSRQDFSKCKSPQSPLFVEHGHDGVFESGQIFPEQTSYQSSLLPEYLPCGFPFIPKASSVKEIIQAAATELIDIGNYSEFQMRLTEAEQVQEMLHYFLPGEKLGTTPLMCILSLLGWDSSTLLVKVPSIDKVGNRKWGVMPHHTQLIIPYNPSDHWILMRVDLRAHQVSSFDSCGEHALTNFCQFIKDKLAQDNPQVFGASVWEHKNELTLQQEGGSDCGFHLLENARRLSEGESLIDKPINILRLRVFYAEMLLARSRYEKSERVALDGLLEAAPSTNIKARITGKRKRGLEDFEVESEDDYGTITLDDLQALLPGVSKELIVKYQSTFQQCILQKSTQSTMSIKQANQLICMVAAVGSSTHFLALKKAIQQYRLKCPIETPSPTDKQHERLYKLGLGSERLGLINTITQRVVRAQCAMDINEARERINGEREKAPQSVNSESEETALQQAINMVASKYRPDSSSAEDVVKTIRRWRTDSTFWSMLWGYCSTFAVLLLIPHQIQFGKNSVSGTAYRHIPKNAREVFFKALKELNPSIWSYVPNLGNLYAALVNRERLHQLKFKIEDIEDNVITASPPGSDVLIEAFDLCEASPASNTN